MGDLKAEDKAQEIFDQYVDELPPPPPYYEVVRQEDAPPGYSCIDPPFTHFDFLPDNFASKYDELVSKANAWLAANRGFRLHSCETITFPVKNGVYCHQESLLRVPNVVHNRDRVMGRGLRCWLTRETDPSQPTQVLCTVVRVPRRKKGVLAISFGPGGSYHTIASVGVDSLFEPLTATLHRFNDELTENPLPGRILRIETTETKVTELLEDTNLNPDKLFWTESFWSKMYLTSIRMFYISGEPAHEVVNWKNVIPVYVRTSNPYSPQFEPFTATLYKAGHWAYTQTGLRITNIQTVEAKIHMNVFAPPSQYKPCIDADRSDFIEPGAFMNVSTVRFLRIFYVTSPEAPVDAMGKYTLTHRSFLPHRVGYRQFEDPVTNIRRMGQWIDFNKHCAGFSVDDIICAETVHCDYYIGTANPPNSEKTSYKRDSAAGHHLVSGIRLYLNGMPCEPPVGFFSIPPPYVVPQTECCNIL